MRFRPDCYVAFACFVVTVVGFQPLHAAEDANVQVPSEMSVATFTGHDSEVTMLAFNSDGSRVVSVSSDSVCFWNPSTGNEIKRLMSGAYQVSAFSSDLSRLAIAHS